jgi:simple sugar transport system permease protein
MTETDAQVNDATTPAAAEPPPSWSEEEVRRPAYAILLGSMREFVLLPAIAVVVVVGVIVSPSFLTSANLTTVIEFSAPLGLLVVGESLTLIFGQMDLSLQGIYLLAPGLAAYLTVHPSARLGTIGAGTNLPGGVGLLILIAIGAACALVLSTLVVKLRMNAFILGLALLILWAGLEQGITNSATIFSLPPALVYIGNHDWFGFPVAAWIEIAVFLGTGAFLRYHRTGRAVYAIGGNIEAARAAGIKVDRIMIGFWMYAGVLGAVAGLMTAGQVDAITANQGQSPGIIFQVFAAAVIGGISLQGGKGRMLGAFTGVILLELIINVLTLGNVSSFWQYGADGAIIVTVLVVTRLIAFVQGREVT